MKSQTAFSFQRFVELLRKALEISIILAAITRTALVAEWFVAGRRFSRLPLIESVDTFLITCVLLFVPVAVYRLYCDGRRSIIVGLRAFAYIVFVVLMPVPSGLMSLSAVQRPNHAMERTPDRRALDL